MTIEPTPRYHKDLHPLELWNSWYSKNEAEIMRTQQENNNKIYDKVVQYAKNYTESITAFIRFNQEVEKLSEIRCPHTYQYVDIFDDNNTWSPLLKGSERMEFDSQILRFYKDNRFRGEINRRPRTPAVYNSAMSFIIIDLNSDGNNEVNNMQSFRNLDGSKS